MLVENDAAGEVTCVIPTWRVSTIAAQLDPAVSAFCAEYTTDDIGNYCLFVTVKNPDEFFGLLEVLSNFEELWPVKVRTKVFTFMDVIANLEGDESRVGGDRNIDGYLVAEYMDHHNPVFVYWE